MSLQWTEARARVVAAVRNMGRTARVEQIPFEAAAGRVLAVDVKADRDQPPFHRATRDGFAVRSADVAKVPRSLRRVGEVAAGAAATTAVAAGECVEIMTGAPLPAGADAVAMVETATRDGDAVRIDRSVAAGENVVAAGSELAAGAVALRAGARLGPAQIALCASLGQAKVRVVARPIVAFFATGDELVAVDAAPAPHQIRDSNSWALAAQVARAGAVPRRLPPARDDEATLRARFEEALVDADLLIFSGGISKGKYDLAGKVFQSLGGRVTWQSVDIRPGKPAMFGEIGNRPVFGLPGNPVSTMVTFELFARAAVDVLGGGEGGPLVLARLPLAAPFVDKPLQLTCFFPATLGPNGATPLRHQGSGDIAALARAQALVVIPPGTDRLAAGTFVDILPW
ncbi:MAG TPA: gephyrin-like molybdotransferase Glp [Haliangiales bacterium]|nr:gephyrin-like molybdotransferase Glp [Haliangiales bacterium]